GQQLGEGVAGDQVAQDGLAGAVQRLARFADFKEEDARLGDAVADGTLHLDEVAVAGDHERLFLDLVDAVGAVRAGPGPRSRHGTRPTAEADLQCFDLVRPDAPTPSVFVYHHYLVLDRPRPAPVQARSQVFRERFAEAADDGHLAALDYFQTAEGVAG